MKILITSGGTTEPIDQVRGITNHSTGQLGKILAQTFLDQGHEVSLITTALADKPDPQENLTIHLIKTVADLTQVMEHQVPQHQVLIHAMAVSDYSPVYMTDLETVKDEPDWDKLLTQSNQEAKISSRADYQVLLLRKNPKLINLVKTWNPDIQLIGFKLLVDVSRDDLIAVARQSLEKNQADLIVANDLSQINSSGHQAYLVSPDQVTEASSKTDIAQAIYDFVTERSGS